MNKYGWFALVALLLALVACSPTGGQEQAADPTAPGQGEGEATGNGASALQGTRWVLVSYRDAAGEIADALADREVTAEFGADGQMGGNAGCNSYFAAYTVDGRALTIGQAGSTMMACMPETVMQQEAGFLAALQSAATYAIAGDTLTLSDAAGDTALTLRATQPASLTGATWVATSLNNGRQAVVSIADGGVVTATFTEDGQLNGSAGCNSYMTGYTLDGQAIAIEPPASTRKLCPDEAVMAQEAAYFSLLPSAASWRISGTTLELRAADGALIASFAPQ